MKKYEYYILPISKEPNPTDREIIEMINELGYEGWEIVAVTPLSLNGDTLKLQYLFKREFSKN
jgi:hypothetical protein